MNFYILINFRKIRSNDTLKPNFLKIELKDIGIKGEKKYKSKTIVNDMKMDFSINLLEKALNYTKDKPDFKISLKPKGAIKLEKKPNLNKSFEKRPNLNKSFEKRTNVNKAVIKRPNLNKSFDTKPHINKTVDKKRPDPKPKITLFQRAMRAFSFVTKIRSFSITNRPKKSNTIYKPPPKVKENHVEHVATETIKEEKYLNQKNANSKKKIVVKKNIFKKEEKQQSQQTRITNKSYTTEKNKNIKPIATKEKKPLNKLKTIKLDEIILEPVQYDKYLSENNPKNKNAKHRETFCEGFFIASFPQKDGQVVEKSQSFPASCGHEECSSLPSMKPEIILRYPLEDTKTLELNNLAATICFPTGIKVCYSENEPEMIKDYVTPITNQKGERYYMMTYHFYLKMANDIYSKNYEMHPLKHHLMKFADNYLNMSEEEMGEEVTEQIQKNLEQAQELGFRDFVFVPFSICLISKYPYVFQMKKCLQSIYCLLINNNENLKDSEDLFKINYLIMHLINSVPIPDIETRIQFYLPYFNKEIELKCPKINDLKIMNTSISELLKLFSIDYIAIILRFLLFERKILFIDDDYTRLSRVTDNFISLLYPFQWAHTYIPIMSDQMLKYLETFLPFLNGIHSSLMPLVTENFQTDEMEESEEMFLIYINISKFRLGSTLVGKTIRKYKYVEENIPALPSNLEKELKNKLKKIKDEIETFQKKNPNNKDLSEFDFKIRNAFIQMFVQMFHDIDKYLCFLDDDIVFNKNLFLETIPNNEKKFYDEFIDTQLFQLFIQNFIKDDFNYFKSMISEFNKNKKFLNDDKHKESVKNYVKKIYIINPDYLGIKEKNRKNIEMKIKEKYDLKEEKDKNGFLVNSKRITEYMQKIDDNNYDNKNCNIYLIPEKVEKKVKIKGKNNLLNDILSKKANAEMKNLFKKFIRTKTYKNKLTEKEKDEIKEKIKDFTVKIFKSEEIEEDNNLKKDLQNDINTNFGREFFVNLLSKNTSNVILLKDNSFNLLGTLIYNTLLYILQIEETNQALEQIVILIKSTMFLGKEEKETVGYFITTEKTSTVTLWDIYKQRIRKYPKVSQFNLWDKWYENYLTAEKENENDEVKKKIILQICDLMIELELIKSFIKNTLEKLIKKVFGNNEENNKAILQDCIQKIITAKYVSKAEPK